MCLTLRAVSNGYHYSKTKEDVVGKEYGLSTDIGYGGFCAFRIALAAFASNGKFSDAFNDVYDDGTKLIEAFMNDSTLQICVDGEDFAAEDSTSRQEKTKAYKAKLAHMKDAYPKLYQVFPLVAHCDCEGEMPYKQCKMILPVIKEFYEQDNRNYGYPCLGYNFTEELIDILEEAVSHKGKLYFS